MASIFSFYPTFPDVALVYGLPHREDCLDEDAHGSLGRVDAAHHAEAQALPTGALLEFHGQDLHREGLGAPGDLGKEK